tara:strand:- start:426 stop:851 length:426 start_codon:yes stop_codon:yes gene_type:complete
MVVPCPSRKGYTIMSKLSKKEYVSALRSLARFLESRPDLDTPSAYPSVYLSDWDVPVEKQKEWFKQQARALKGAKKFYDGSLMSLEVEGKNWRLTVSVNREAVCKKVSTGRYRTIPGRVVPERTEEIFDYECPESLLKPQQ